MKSKFIRMLCFSVLIGLFFCTSAFASSGIVTPFYEPNPEYPNSNIEMKPGDVLYSTKGYSTFFVGHVGIVGEDLAVYHSHPESPYKFADSIETYFGRHKRVGDEIRIYRTRDNTGLQAARWARSNLDLIQSYTVYNIDLNDLRYNYCSKFIWQAFWYSNGIDLTGQGLTDKSHNTIYPFLIKNSSRLVYVGSFYR